MNRPFDHYPPEATCPVCRTNKNRPCVLIPIDYTNKGNIEEAQPVHIGCINLRYSKSMNLFYQNLGERNE